MTAADAAGDAIPDDLARALAAFSRAGSAFAALPAVERRELVAWVVAAPDAEERAHRAAATAARLNDG